jgi:hypothetical protein
MTQTRIRLTRAELYEKVWATPVRTLAKEFGMSDVGALRIINALFLELEERGQSVSWSKEEEATLTLVVDGETVRFCVLEITESLRHVLTPEEQKRPWTAPKWDYKLTGKLQFRVDNLPYSAGVRGTWSDGKCQRLEKCIGDFIVGLSELLKPYDAYLMRCYAISARINHVANDDEECCARVELTQTQARLFL